MEFKKILMMKQEELKTALTEKLKEEGYSPQIEDGFIYAAGDIPVLLVAHMDTVHKELPEHICESADGDILIAPLEGIGGDDRCGIFMVLETIKTHRCHVLFTEDEEIGLVGAGKFAASDIKPKVNWILEYDRKGSNDAVFYSCDNPEFTEFITDKDIGFVFAHGSASDISRVAPAINRAAVNLSCGYYDQHKKNEYIIISEMMTNIERGKRLIDKPCDKPFEYIEKKYTYSGYSYGTGSSYKSYYDDYDKYYRKPYISYNSYSAYNDEIKNLDDDFEDEDVNTTTAKDLIRDEIYDKLDDYAIRWYRENYGVGVAKKESLIYPDDILDFDSEEYIITDGTDSVSYDDYSFESTGDVLIDKNTNVYILKADDIYGIEVAVKTDKYLARKGGKDILYYPEKMAAYYTMSDIEFATFCEYTEAELESEIELEVFSRGGVT